MPDFPLSIQLVNAYSITPYSVESIGRELEALSAVSASFAWPTANLALFIPVEIYQPVTIVKMSVGNGTAVSGNIDVGIYDQFGNKKITSGSTAQAGTSVIQTFDITDTLLNPGLYYLAVAADNTTATFAGASGVVVGDGQAMGLFQQASAFVLPSPATFAAYAQTVCPIVAMHQRTTV